MKRTAIIGLAWACLGITGCGPVTEVAAWRAQQQGRPVTAAVLRDAANAGYQYDQSLPPDQRLARDLAAFGLMGLLHGAAR